MHVKWSMVWRVAKIGLAVLIVVGVGWQFAKVLGRPELAEQPIRADASWLVAALVAYLVAVSCWAGYWWRLLRRMGEVVSPGRAAMAYFASQLGKYVPGKALVIVMRASMAGSAGVRTSVAAVTSFYETLTTMACGALVAAILLLALNSRQTDALAKAMLLLLAGIALVPRIFNELAARAARPFFPANAPPLPRITFGTLLGGLLQTAVGWFFLGASLLFLMRSLRPDVADLSVEFWLTCTAYTAVAYVAGFFMLAAPGGLGVREYVLQASLAEELAARLGAEAAGFAIVVALLLRLLWSGTEVVLATASLLFNRLIKAKV